MRRFKFFSLLRHAVLMVGRKFKNYGLLSVTVVISFSLLLGYLLYTDSVIYNENKELFSYRREDISVYLNADLDALHLLQDNLDAIPETAYYVQYEYVIGSSSGSFTLDIYGDPQHPKEISSLGITAKLLPDHSWPQGTHDLDRKVQIVWLDGQEHWDFTLEANQVILSEATYRIFGMEDEADPVFHLNVLYGQKIPLEVVGYVKDGTYEEWLAACHMDKMGENIRVSMILSTKFPQYAQWENKELWADARSPRLIGLKLKICSKRPEDVATLLESFGYSYLAIYQYQDQVLDGIRTEKQTKAIISCALLVLLGINLYSCFSNALADRRYEIGVKRALGASGWSIVRQFLYESLIVMVANTLVSVSLVADLAAIYKYMVEHTPMEDGSYQEFILYISPYSVAMFGVCAITLTVVFSLIFAFQATRVEIIKHLKAE